MAFFSKFEMMVAWRYLFSCRQETFISIAALISFIGVMIGVMALIVVMSVMNGFRNDIISRILDVNGHILVKPRYFPCKNYHSIVTKISDIENVTKVFPFVSGQAFAANVNGGAGVSVRGMVKEDFFNIMDYFSNFYGDKFDDFNNGKGIFIGESLAQNLGVNIGDKVKLISPNGDITPLGTDIRSKFYTISAIFKTRVSYYDNGVVYMSLKEAQLYFNMENYISGIEVFVKDPDMVESTNYKIKKIIGDDMSVTDWRYQNKSFFSAMEVEQNVMFVILTLIVFVAVLNIVSSLFMLVKEKVKDIAVLRTMGATIYSIMRIFFIIGAFIGVSGTFFGVVGGVLIALNIELIRQFFLNTFGIVIFNTDAYLLSGVPIKISCHEIFWIVVMAVMLSFLATIFPSWRASRIDPVKSLRYE
ncbi:MAG: lipoprotein-releasing system transmembrane subunit LolC [Candidatus Liberibacter europaeus]|uniref:Lipoprotein-releasing system transmembrane subunit LolC n=1 Tax=Candidatus Liberibacter europaeus TaxID=744859 RepID=A0A2T4VXC0_9HYPH|nr:lipoprotein-releasing ABC transporter permease subunit [Candidatus Liberibacter europaeus]PTL86433.1 MAG: lipoprotein-releasing system transmembrane subunit LolC [Candidatus Liberibacter europaeus]